MQDAERISLCRAAYIRGECGIKKLSQRYEISINKLRYRAQKENWKELRLEAQRASAQESVKNAADETARKGACLTDACLKVLKAVTERLTAEELLKTARDIKDVACALRELRDVMQVRTDLDDAEQRARIEKLLRDAKAADADDEIRVIFGEDDALSA